MIKIYQVAVLSLFSVAEIHAQSTDLINQELSQRVAIAPESVFTMFREAEMNPVNHVLTESEKAKVENAFALLPPLHKKVLGKHLLSISFMDNMPNTALTSPVEGNDSAKLFNITFRAGILNETISEWATWKENTCYDRSASPGYEIHIEAGKLDAIVYVLLHEATHVLDAVLEVTPHLTDKSAIVKPTSFTGGVWHKMNVPDKAFIDSLLEKTLFRSGKTVPIESAPDIYEKLRKTPFVSLYGMASWFEDLAELETIYHLTTMMHQPYYVIVKNGGNEITRFYPMKNKLVIRRLKQLKKFYQA
jgi:hypothetical protein